MKNPILLCLVGEQPIPNLLPILHICPRQVVLVATQHSGSVRVANALNMLLCEKGIESVIFQLTREYSIEGSYLELDLMLNQAGIRPTHINLTGGTKAMSLAAFQLAKNRNIPCYYLESNQKARNQLYVSQFENEAAKQVSIETINEMISLDDFIKAFGYQASAKEPRDKLEIAVCTAIRDYRLFEVKAGVEFDTKKNSDIDIMLRHEDRYAVIEVKRVVREWCENCKAKIKPKPKQALEQIVTISEQRIFGTYTNRILVLHCSKDEISTIDGITDMCRILNTRWILLHDDLQDGKLSHEDRERLRGELYSIFGISQSITGRGA